MYFSFLDCKTFILNTFVIYCDKFSLLGSQEKRVLITDSRGGVINIVVNRLKEASLYECYKFGIPT